MLFAKSVVVNLNIWLNGLLFDGKCGHEIWYYLSVLWLADLQSSLYQALYLPLEDGSDLDWQWECTPKPLTWITMEMDIIIEMMV